MIRAPSFDYSALAAEFAADSVQAQVLKALSDSTAAYSYGSVEELLFELNLRSEITGAAVALNESGMGFAVFEKTKCSPDFWIRQANGGFLLKNGVLGSDAVNDIYENGGLYATECATAMVIVYYRALLKLLSPETFDRLFPRIYLMNWSVRDPLLYDVSTPQPAADHLLGDRVYFNNPDVSPEAPWWQGENVIILPGGVYYGHGVGINSAERIATLLNRQRKEGATVSAYLMDTAGRPDFKKLYAAANRPAPQTSRLVWRPFPPPIAARV